MHNISLFQFATSELSQDAFLCWLLSSADPNANVEDTLQHVAQQLLQSLFATAGLELPKPVSRIEVQKQLKNIDIIVNVNNERHVLVIEDKVFTQDHSDQLERYARIARSEFPNSEIGFVYFKTGNQSSFDSVDELEFNVFGRGQFLEILKRGIDAGVTNDIFLDYTQYLSGIDDSIQAYKHKKLDDWDWDCWTGFFTDLQQNHLNDAQWDYVPNAAGGFMGLWWHGRDNKYLQLEQEKLCFKIIVDDKSLQSEHRNEWHSEIVEMSESSKLKITKPDRFGKGTYMTAAILEDGDYRQTDDSGCLDLERTVQILKAVEELLDAATGATEIVESTEQ